MSSLSSEQLKELKRSVILDKLAYLCEELGDPGRYFPELRSKHVLDVTDTDVIKSKHTEREKTEEFVTIISKRSASNGQHGLDVLVEALRKQRVHAHVARTLTRALNKKKAEAERTSAPLGGASQHVAGKSPPSCGNSLAPDPPQLHPSDSHPHSQTPTSNASTSSSQLDMHPKHGLLPPNPPPPSAPDNSFPSPVDGIDGDTHPQHGLRPPHPPPTPSNGNYVAPQQVTSLDTPSYSAAPNGGYTEASNSQCSDELGPQSMTHTETSMSSMSTNDTSFSTGDFEKVLAPPGRALSNSSAASRSSYHSAGSIEDQSFELDRLRKEVVQLKAERTHLQQMVTGLQHENSQLREQLVPHRPSNLQFMQPRPPPYYSQGHWVDYNSLTPSSRSQVLRPRNPSPSPGGDREFGILRPANSSGSLNSYSSKGSYTPSESQV